jgi:hypothetical protein
MSYKLDMLICVGMILLDNSFQCLLFIAVIDLSRTCDSKKSSGQYLALIYDE